MSYKAIKFYAKSIKVFKKKWFEIALYFRQVSDDYIYLLAESLINKTVQGQCPADSS